MKKWVAILAAIGFLHRLLFLGARQLWTDELMQARIIKLASPAEILSRLRGGMDLASPLDFLVQRGMTSLFGDAAWAMRLHAVIFGTLAILVFYRLACFLYGQRVALYSTVLFAFFPLALHYSQEARPYALLMLLSLVSYDALLRQLYGRQRHPLGWLLVAAVSALLLYTSYLGALILISQFFGIVLSAAWKRNLKIPAGSNAPESSDAVDWGQVFVFSLCALAAVATFYPWVRFTWAKPLLAPVSEIMDPKLVLRLIKELGDNSYPIAGLLLIGAVTGVRALVRHKDRRSLVWLLTWFVIPIPVLLAVEVWAGYFFAIRHLLHATPPLVLLAGYGLSYVGERLTILSHLPYHLSSPAIAFAAVLIVGSVWIGVMHTHNEPADWRGTSEYLNGLVADGDALAMPKVYPLLEYYYPGLAAHRTGDLDPGAGSLGGAAVMRRIVVCYDKMWPDPCGSFRTPALRDPVWVKHQFTGFMVFLRNK